LCIPSSVETVSLDCFLDCGSLSGRTFEPGPRLSTLGRSALPRQSHLHSIWLSATLRQVTGLSLANSELRNTAVDGENRFLRISGNYLLDFEQICLVRYFGQATALISPSSIVSISSEMSSSKVSRNDRNTHWKW
jgi:hypothetical protein